jgi:hypothetical protein
LIANATEWTYFSDNLDFIDEMELQAILASYRTSTNQDTIDAGKVPTSRTVGGKSLNIDVILTASDVGAASADQGIPRYTQTKDGTQLDHVCRIQPGTIAYILITARIISTDTGGVYILMVDRHTNNSGIEKYALLGSQGSAGRIGYTLNANGTVDIWHWRTSSTPSYGTWMRPITLTGSITGRDDTIPQPDIANITELTLPIYVPAPPVSSETVTLRCVGGVIQWV